MGFGCPSPHSINSTIRGQTISWTPARGGCPFGVGQLFRAVGGAASLLHKGSPHVLFQAVLKGSHLLSRNTELRGSNHLRPLLYEPQSVKSIEFCRKNADCSFE